MKSLILIIEAITEMVGRLASWLVLAMVLLICYDVAMRYLFQQGSVALQELEWHLFALIFLLGSAYTLKYDEHVRVDILYQSRFLTDRHRALINIFGTLLLLFPFCILILITAWPFMENAFHYNVGICLAFKLIVKSNDILDNITRLICLLNNLEYSQYQSIV